MINLQEMKKAPYGNWEVLNRHGQLIFRCDEERASWYLNRNLASVVRDETIQLNFETNGPGNLGDEYYLARKEYRCVVCGCYNTLTKHHVVPKFYRRNMPEKLKSRNSFDILVLCIPCHAAYERQADIFRKELSEKYDVPFSGIGPQFDPWRRKVKKAAVSLHFHAPKMKPAQLEKNQGILRHHLGREATEEDVRFLMTINTDNPLHADHGKALMAKVTDYEEFVFSWRGHFIKTMDPQYMPVGWDQFRPLKK